MEQSVSDLYFKNIAASVRAGGRMNKSYPNKHESWIYHVRGF